MRGISISGFSGGSSTIIKQLFNLSLFVGIPDHIGSDNGPEYTARAVRKWLDQQGVETLFIELWSPWENGYIESFNGKLTDELLDWEVFKALTKTKVLIEAWRTEYNQVRPYSSLGYRPKAPEGMMATNLT